ncbi:TraR/DksA family transcriptional regulator [Aridibaculum aurantiacum]|uniref:TraR/DksA family transcriptional regulator n=1 Tax=Aridibaculum aurantiacum TaxID=2810307 RepID=UPI003158A981
MKKASDNTKESKATTTVKKAAVVPEAKAAKAAPAKPVEDKKTAKAAAPAKTEEKAPAAKAPAAKKAEPKAAKPVVIPKTSTDKKVDYEPDFMKSVLDTPAPTPQGPTMRYSDAELQEFRELINKKLDAAKKELAYLQGLITRRDELGGDETDNRYMTMEDGGMSMEREQLSQMASRQITFIDHLEKAIMRIENKTYGICRVTGKLIDKARLRAVPHATLSMEAKLGIVK